MEPNIDWSFYWGIGFGLRRFDDGSWIFVLPFVIVAQFNS